MSGDENEQLASEENDEPETSTGEDLPEEADDPTDGPGTTTTRYRWKYLSTLVSLFLVFQFPAFLVLISFYGLEMPEGTVTGILAFAWLIGIAYSVGTDIVKEVKDIQG